MKHAILIIAHTNEYLIHKLIELYDDSNIDFYIHVDKKAKQFNFDFIKQSAKLSHIIFIPRIKTYWGDYSLSAVELNLFEHALKKHYDYYHLISGSDFPLQTKKEFLEFFEKNKGQEFIEYTSDEITKQNKIYERIEYYHFFIKTMKNKNIIIRKIGNQLHDKLLSIQKICHLKRSSFPYCYGSNWVDLTHECVQYILDKRSWIEKHFHHTLACDEIILHTIIKQSPFYEKIFTQNIIKAPRHVDWNRGQPYTYTFQDYEEIISIHESFFIRKIENDKRLIDKLSYNIEKQIF